MQIADAETIEKGKRIGKKEDKKDKKDNSFAVVQSDPVQADAGRLFAAGRVLSVLSVLFDAALLVFRYGQKERNPDRQCPAGCALYFEKV